MNAKRMNERLILERKTLGMKGLDFHVCKVDTKGIVYVSIKDRRKEPLLALGPSKEIAEIAAKIVMDNFDHVDQVQILYHGIPSRLFKMKREDLYLTEVLAYLIISETPED